MKIRLVQTAIVTLCLLYGLPARAFICTRVSEGGSGIYWFRRQAMFTFFDAGTNNIEDELEFEVMRNSFRVWEELTTAADDPCDNLSVNTDFQWLENPIRSTVDRIGYNYLDEDDNENLVIFRDNTWPYPGEREALALATVTFNTITGEILDADVEFNTADHDFTIGPVPRTDLLNTAVHEVGHLLGLAHVPDPDATMFDRAGLGDTKKRTLSCDERDAMIFKYPAEDASQYCDANRVDDSCGFCAPPGTLEAVADATQTERTDGGCRATSQATWLALLAVLPLCFRRRKTPNRLT